MSAFFPETRKVEIGGREVEISPLPVRKLAKAARIVGPMAAYFVGEGGPDFVGVLTNHADDLIELCALASGLDEEFVGDLNAAELLKLATPIVEVNADFFIRAVLPEISRTMEAFGTVAKSATVSTGVSPA